MNELLQIAYLFHFRSMVMAKLSDLVVSIVDDEILTKQEIAKTILDIIKSVNDY